jgi:predicted XRE-type DNA-binding protein
MTRSSNSNYCPRVEFQVHFQIGHRGRKNLKRNVRLNKHKQFRENLSRLTKLLALAHRWNRLILEGSIVNQVEIARIFGISRARVSQIMDLAYLTPEIQEHILFGKIDEVIPERVVRSITHILIWEKQRGAWRQLAGRILWPRN